MLKANQLVGFGAGSTGAVTGSADPYFPNVVLLLHGEGTNNGTTFTDSSATPKVITASGNAVTSTTQFKYGTTSMYFDGTGDFLSVPDSTSLNLDGDFTVECWVRMDSVASEYLVFSNHTSNNHGVGLTINAGAPRMLAGNGTWFVLVNSSITIGTGTWNHIAYTRCGDTHTIWVNGVSGGTATSSTTPTYSGGARIGKFIAGTELYFPGYIDDFRITKGVARYTGNFTPPSAAFPDAGPAGFGGAVTFSGGYAIHTFTATGVNTFAPPYNLTAIDYLLVAGGGSGGGVCGGGGGAGGVLTGTTAITPIPYSLTVGNGGGGVSGEVAGTTGGNTTGLGLTAYGGGGGGGYYNQGVNGGSGGGGGRGPGASATAGTGTGGQGYAGGIGVDDDKNGGGGGGAGAVGAAAVASTSGGNGGAGISSSITGAALYYGGGGGGSSRTTGGSTPGTGGSGVGGTGGIYNTTAPTAVTANTGSGGGGGGGGASGAGADGVVILRYLQSLASTYATWNPSDKDADITLSGGNLIATQSAIGSVRATVGKASGKWYWETTITTYNTSQVIGFGNASATITDYTGANANSWGYYPSGGYILVNGANGGTAVTGTTNDVIGIGLDMDNSAVYFYKNGVLMIKLGSLAAATYYPMVGCGSTGSCVSTVNLGQNPLKYTPPNGTFWNPKDMGADMTLSTNNLRVAVANLLSTPKVRSNTSKASGKWYFEVVCLTFTSYPTYQIGLCQSGAVLTSSPGYEAAATGIGYTGHGGGIYKANALVSATTGYTAGDIIGVAYDATNGTVDFYKNGSLIYAASGGNVPSGPMFASVGSSSGYAVAMLLNAGATPFAYTVPTGFAAWDETTYTPGVY